MTNVFQTTDVPEQIVNEFREIFRLFDKNDDGIVTTKEMGTVMRSLGQMPTEAEIKAMMKKVDADGNGTMEFGEFMALVSTKLEAVDVCEEILEAFRVFDKKGSGRMSKSELRSIIVTLGEKVDEDEADYMLAETDGDRDEMINYCKLAKMISP